MPGASTGGLISATSVPWSSRPAAGAVRSYVTSSGSTAGYAAANAASSRVRMSPAAATLDPTRSRPETEAAACNAAVTPRSSPASVARAESRNAAPAGVSTTPRLVRRSSTAPTASSSCRIWVDSTCCATCTRRAPALKLASSATATKYRRCRSSMFIESATPTATRSQQPWTQ